MQMDTAGYLSIIGTLPVFAKVYLSLIGCGEGRTQGSACRPTDFVQSVYVPYV
jgi:hypothetical protein